MRPAVVIVHGAWHVPDHYALLVSALRARGFEVHIPHLPTTSPQAGSKTQIDDEDVLRALVSSLVSDSREVVVLAHSYGGAVVTRALGSLAAPSRRSGASDGGPRRAGVVHLIYMAAFMLRRGETALSVSQPRPVPEMIALRADGVTTEVCVDPISLFYADVEPELARRCADMLVPSSARTRVPVEEVAWERIPATYIVCTEDAASLPVWQWGMIEAARKEGAEVEVELLKAGHSPFLSKTTEVAAIVERVAGKYE